MFNRKPAKKAAKLEFKAAKKEVKAVPKRNRAALIPKKQAVKAFKKEADKKIGKIAKAVALPSFVVASKLLQKSPTAKKKITNFVKRGGLKPVEDINALATQAAMIQKAKETGLKQTYKDESSEGSDVEYIPDDEDIEAEVIAEDMQEIEDEADDIDYENSEYENESDYFESNFVDPATMAAVQAVGAKGVAMIKAKRAAKGKKFLGRKLDPKTGNYIDAEKKSPTAAKILADTGIDAVEKEKVKEYTRKYAPFVILALVVIVGLAFYFGRKK